MGENIAPWRIPPGWIRLGLVVTVLFIGIAILLTGMAVRAFVASLGGTPSASVLDTPTPIRAGTSAIAAVPTPTPLRPAATLTFSRTPAPTATTIFTNTPTPPRPTDTPTATPAPKWIRLTNSTEDFSNSQGTNNWYYMASNGRDSGDFQEIPWDPDDDWWEWCYDPALGKAPCPEKYVGWRSNCGHPGMHADIARVWVSPVVGKLKIAGSASKEHGGGDGVLIEIYHEHSSGRDKLWTEAIGANDTSSKDFSLVIEVGKGDGLFFVLKIRGRPEWDKTFLDVTIYTLESAAAAPTPKTQAGVKTMLPPITSYKNKIVFKSDREGREALYVMNPEGGDQRRLEDESVYHNALALEALSPDRSRKLLVRDTSGNNDIYTIDVAGRESEQRITSDAADDHEAVWAPIDQNRIAFVSTRMGSTDIWTQNIHEPLQEKRLTDNPDYDKHPSWSPDGTQIVYWAVHGGGPRQIWVMNADGSNKRNISNNTYNDWDPIWIKQP